MTRETAKEFKEADSNPAPRSALKSAVKQWSVIRPQWIAEYEHLTGWQWEKMPANMLSDLITYLHWRDAYKRPVWEYLSLKRDFG